MRKSARVESAFGSLPALSAESKQHKQPLELGTRPGAKIETKAACPQIVQST
jgi:hypothetical protein